MNEKQNIKICPCCKNETDINENKCPYCGENLSYSLKRKDSIAPLVITVLAIMFVISLFVIVQKVQKFQSLINNSNNSNSILKVSYINKQKTEPKELQKQELLFAKYIDNLQKDIKNNWNPPRGDESNRVVVLFKLDKQGNLLNAKIVHSSGSKCADEAAIYAVQKSAPFDSLPIEFTGDSVDIQFTFDYNVFGLQDNKK